jgi:methyl-accepting chemotaxis protein
MVGAQAFEQMVESLPIGVMTCDLKDFKINYLNKFSRETFKKIEHLLPCRADQVMGICIDVFHKDPAHQRAILADPNRLPYQSNIRLGDEILDLLVSPIFDAAGNYVAPMVTWSIVTDRIKAEEDSVRQAQMIDQMPVNVMFMEPENFTITYMNRTSLETLQPLASLLPAPPEQIVGQCVDIFHKEPAHQRGILGDPANLPHSAKIRLGEEHLDLRVNAVNDREGKYIGAMLTWSVITSQVKLADSFEADIKSVVQSVAAAATEMQSTAGSLSSTASDASSKASTVSAAAEELSASIGEISSQVARSSTIAQNAVTEAERSNQMVQGLANSADKIGEVVKLITDIASQTNLLALNATIEAARAGEAGKGFAVVASEVKALANQTARATEEIASQIGEIQGATNTAVTAIGAISDTINEISSITSGIAAAVEEQGAATQDVTANIMGVTDSSAETGEGANQVLQAASELSQQAEMLGAQVDTFLEEIRAQ